MAAPPTLFVSTLLWSLLGQITEGKPPRIARPPRTELSNPCSQKDSRTIRRRLESEVTSKSGVPTSKRSSVNVTWPETCPLHPLLDLWGNHERAKSRMTEGRSKPGSQEWSCKFSGKVFKSEHYVDLHMENFWMKETPPNGQCLGRYCNGLEFCNKKPTPSWGESLSSEPPPCDPSELKEQRTKCEDILDSCFVQGAVSIDINGTEVNATAIKGNLHKTWCAPLDCEAQGERHFAERRSLIVVVGFMAFLGLGFLGLYIYGSMSEETPSSNYNRNTYNFQDSRYRRGGMSGLKKKYQ